MRSLFDQSTRQTADPSQRTSTGGLPHLRVLSDRYLPRAPISPILGTLDSSPSVIELMGGNGSTRKSKESRERPFNLGSASRRYGAEAWRKSRQSRGPLSF